MASILAGLVPLLGLMFSYAVHILICLCVGLHLSIEILCNVFFQLDAHSSTVSVIRNMLCIRDSRFQ